MNYLTLVFLFLALMVIIRSLTYLVSPHKRIPISVNYHLTRVCNYSCGIELDFEYSTSKLSI